MRRGWPVRIVIVGSPLEAVKFSMPVPVKLSAAGERLYHKRYIEEATLSGVNNGKRGDISRGSAKSASRLTRCQRPLERLP